MCVSRPCNQNEKGHGNKAYLQRKDLLFPVESSKLFVVLDRLNNVFHIHKGNTSS